MEGAFRMVGKTLGHYQIPFQLGKGGIGEVYQAKDQKLGRDVAIKALPVEFAKDANRVARFQREAKVLTALKGTEATGAGKRYPLAKSLYSSGAGESLTAFHPPQVKQHAKENVMKRLATTIAVLILGAVSVPACKQEATVQVLARGAPIRGANGLYFDKLDRLHIGSVFAREIVVMDPNNGKILDRIGYDHGVDTPDDVTFGLDGSLYWTAIMTGEVGRLTPGGNKLTIAKGLTGANPVTFSDDGRLFIARNFTAAGLYELDPNGVKPPRPIDEKLADLNAFDFGVDGRLYAPIMSSGKVVSIDVDSRAMRTVAEGFKVPVAVKFDAQGRLFVLDSSQGKVFMVDPTDGRKTEYAAMEPGLDNLAFDSRGRLFISNAYTGAIYEVHGDGKVRSVSPGGMTSVGGIAALARADGESIYVPTVFGIVEFDGLTGMQRRFVRAPILESPLRMPMTLSTDDSCLVVSSLLQNAVQVWNPATNAISTEYTDVASPMNAIRFQGDIVVAEMGTKPPRVVRISKENPIIRTTLAELKAPVGLAATRKDLWATDWSAGTVVQIVKAGQQVTPPAVIASGLKGPEGIAVSPDGSLLVVESAAGRLSSINARSGAVSTVAEKLELGLPGPANMPSWIFDGVAVGPSGAIYVGGDKTGVLYRIR